MTEPVNGQCSSCSKVYEEARPKYIMNICICDCYDHLWVMAYDEAAEKIVGISAGEFSQLGDDEVQELVKATRFKEFKLKLVTKNEEYNNEIRKKTSIIRLMELNYGEESKSLLSKLQYLTG